MSKGVDKSGQSCGSKSITGYKNKDLFKRGLSLVVVIMPQARSVHLGVTSRTFGQCCITSGGGS
jgi:hypothetical protein